MGFILLDDAKKKQAVEMLVRKYAGAKYYLNFKTPVELVVAAILSAQTRDVVVNAVTPELFKHYKTAKDFSEAKKGELIKFVGRVSFAGNKAANIIKACTIIQEQHGGAVPKKMEHLLKLPGIGRKTANTILINAYGIINGIPVDTWVIKLSGRIGLSKNKDPDEIEKDLTAFVAKKYWHNFAYVMKAHGKSICRQIPICNSCMLNKICPRNGVTKSN